MGAVVTKHDADPAHSFLDDHTVAAVRQGHERGQRRRRGRGADQKNEEQTIPCGSADDRGRATRLNAVHG
jgi:hypothetical protein